MRIGVAITGDLRKIMQEEVKNIGDAARKSITESTTGLKEDLRNEVRSAGMGNRLATTWRSKFYPNAAPMDSAGLVYSKAPKIIDAHGRGVTIRAKGGKYLAIPTDAAPKKRHRWKACHASHDAFEVWRVALCAARRKTAAACRR